MSTTGPEDRLGRSLDSLVRLGGSRRLHQRQASSAGVAVSQQGFRLLRSIVEAGPLTPGDLARRTDMDPAVVTRQSQVLEAAGLVTRSRDNADGRLSSLAATTEGVRAVQRMRRVLNRHLLSALEEWESRDVAVLADLLERLVADLRSRPYPDLDRPE